MEGVKLTLKQKLGAGAHSLQAVGLVLGGSSLRECICRKEIVCVHAVLPG